MYKLFVLIGILVILYSLTTCRKRRSVSFREMFEDVAQQSAEGNQGNPQQVSPIENILALSQVIDNKQSEIEAKVEANSTQIATLSQQLAQLQTYIKQQTDQLTKAAGG